MVSDVAAGLQGDGLAGGGGRVLVDGYYRYYRYCRYCRYLYLAGGHHGVAHGSQQQPGQQPDVGHTLQELLGALQV